MLAEDFRNRSGSATGIFNPTWSREIVSVVSHSFSTFSILFYQQLHPVPFCLQQHSFGAELQVLFSHFNTLAVTNSGSDTFPLPCFCWTSRDHSHHLTLLPACTRRIPSSESPEGVAFPLLSPPHCVCSQPCDMGTLELSHIPPFQSLLDHFLIWVLTHNIF